VREKQHHHARRQLIPFYGEDSLRRKYKASVTFYGNRALKAVSLDAQQEVLTPIGEMPAELVTFYDTGELKRVFPLDGKSAASGRKRTSAALIFRSISSLILPPFQRC
jgi:hypothetical protein